MLPYDDITIVACEHAVAAPYATRQLADLGARVIKIERPDGGDFARSYDSRAAGMSSYFVWCNRGKESIKLDLKSVFGREAAGRLLARADVLVENLGPGAARRLGLDFGSLAKTHPRLIVCKISGYGASGPFCERRAYDLLIQAESGVLSITGTAEEPCKVGISIADISAASVALAQIQAAIRMRDRTGLGSGIDVSMFETMTEWMSQPLYYASGGQSAPARAGASHASIYPYGAFCCADGRKILLAIQSRREWRRFTALVLGQLDLYDDVRFASNSARSANRSELKLLIDAAFARWTSAECEARLISAGVAYASLNALVDVHRHPQHIARANFVDGRVLQAPFRMIRAPGRSSAYVQRMGETPGLGEHTNSVLAELGYSAEQISRATERGNSDE